MKFSLSNFASGQAIHAGKWTFEQKKKKRGKMPAESLQGSKIMRRQNCQEHGFKRKKKKKKEHIGKCQNSPVGLGNTSEEIWVTVFMSHRG